MQNGLYVRGASYTLFHIKKTILKVTHKVHFTLQNQDGLPYFSHADF